MRFIATGGLFKDMLKSESEITEEEMLLLSDEDEEEKTEHLISFLWKDTKKRYARQTTLPVDNPEMKAAINKMMDRDRIRRRVQEL